jgi:uncharacterized protein YecT (DUF1311 family)
MITYLLALAAAPSAPYTCPQTKTDDLVVCATSKYKKADAALNAVWKRTPHTAEIVKAQRAWLAYRDAMCEAENSASPEGSLYPVFKYLCWAELTDEQVNRLSEIAQR